ncbi:MAG TPA: response regulator [Polyangia bacterium]|jgi:two-component system response regulator MprA
MVDRTRDDAVVLVIDDDFDIRLMIANILELEGFRVQSAANGLEAIRQLQSGLRPTLILLDLMMPVMNGWQFMDEQARDPALRGIPVVLVSGDERLADRAATAGVAGYLRKPVDLDDLLRTVEQYA